MKKIICLCALLLAAQSVRPTGLLEKLSKDVKNIATLILEDLKSEWQKEWDPAKALSKDLNQGYSSYFNVTIYSQRPRHQEFVIKCLEALLQGKTIQFPLNNERIILEPKNLRDIQRCMNKTNNPRKFEQFICKNFNDRNQRKKNKTAYYYTSKNKK